MSVLHKPFSWFSLIVNTKVQSHTLKMWLISSSIGGISHYSNEMQQPRTPLPRLPLMKVAIMLVRYFFSQHLFPATDRVVSQNLESTVVVGDCPFFWKGVPNLNQSVAPHLLHGEDKVRNLEHLVGNKYWMARFTSKCPKYTFVIFWALPCANKRMSQFILFLSWGKKCLWCHSLKLKDFKTLRKIQKALKSAVGCLPFLPHTCDFLTEF